MQYLQFVFYFYDMVGRANEMLLIENSLQYLIWSNAWFIASTWSLSKTSKIDASLISVPTDKWYYVTKIVLTYCEKKCSSDRG